MNNVTLKKKKKNKNKKKKKKNICVSQDSHIEIGTDDFSKKKN